MFFGKKYFTSVLVLIAVEVMSASLMAQDVPPVLGYDSSLPENPPPIEQHYNQQINNWAKNVSFSPEIVFVPKDKRELIEIVKKAQKLGKRISLSGKLHSWNSLMTTTRTDYLVSTVKLKQVWVHSDEGAVTVESGATIADVDRVIEQHGFMVPCNIVGTTDITFGGILATGSHGSGVNCPTMSDFVEEIEFIKSNGESEVVSEATHGAEVMNAARLNLGLFGIMYKIKFKVQRAFNVHVTDQGVPIDQLFDVLPNYLKTHENVEVLWFPLTDRAIIKSWNPIDKAENIGPLVPYIESEVTKWLVYKGLTPFIKCFMGSFPDCIPTLNKVVGPRLFPDRQWIENVNDAIHYVNEAVAYPINETEIAVPYDFDDLRKVEMGWNAMVNAVYENHKNGKYPLNIIVHMRFLKGSKALLSPSLNNQRTCYMDYGAYYQTPGWQELVNQIWLTWRQIPGVKLHWAKDMGAYHELDVRAMYGAENIDRFLEIRKRFDPEGMFANDFIRKLFKM